MLSTLIFKYFFKSTKHRFLILAFGMLPTLSAQIILINHNTGVKRDTEGNEYFVEEFVNGLAFITKGGYYGLVDSSGSILIPVKYESMVRVTDHLYIVQMQQKYGLVNEYDKEITAVKYDILYEYEKGFIYGEFGCEKKWMVSMYPRYLYMHCSNCSKCFVDKTGREFSFLETEAQVDFKGPMSIFYDNNCWFIDSSGVKFGLDNTFFPNEYVNFFHKQKITIATYSGLKKHNVWGWVNNQGNKVFTKFKWIGDFYQGFAIVEAKGKFGVINRWGKLVIPLQYQYIDNFESYPVKAVLKNELIFIDTTGKEVISASKLGYSSCRVFSEGLAGVLKNGKWGFIDKGGIEIIPTQYDSISDFHKGVCLVKRNALYGFIDKNGEEVIPIIYHNVTEFDHGLSRVRLNNLYGFINQLGQVVVEIQYDQALYFQDGLAAVKVEDKYGFVDKTGVMVIPPRFHSISLGGFVNGIVQADGHIFNKKGTEIPTE